MNERETNQEIADSICRDLEWQGREFQPGECVALLDGAVVAVAPDLDQALQALRKIQPDPRRGMVVEVRRPVVDVIRTRVEGMDEEQIELGPNDRLWKLIAKRRQERTLNRAELEKQMSGRSAG